MYTNFFSLSELPFSIAPNPKYLFMSDRHREALTHLSHGLGGVGASDNGGFVLLTGEVGTGKTTVSRCLMDDLPENTQLAFILNPTLSSQELLATICDQLKIRYRKTGATLKTLTDKISEKLLKNHTNNINTILIIDEAQHLEAQVLEQLRLLTNLETNTKKLLQVILIGQPELQQLLKRRDLRQLAQRITARYHLLPLNQQELASYIKHRLSVADCHRALFDKGAIVTIHKLSQGIPRLVNLLCHSALMEAYNSNNAVVDKKIVLKAASHALGDDLEQLPWWQNKNSQIALAASLLMLVLVAGFWLGQSQKSEPMNTEVSNTPIVKTEIKDEPAKKALTPVVKQETNDKETAEKTEKSPEAMKTMAKPAEKTVAELANEKTQELAAEKVAEPVKKQTVSTKKEQQAEQKTEQKTQTEQIVVSGEMKEKASTQTPVSAAISESTEPKPSLAAQQTNNSAIKAASKPTSKPESDNKKYKVEAVEGVSDDLLARFQAAIDDSGDTKNSPSKSLKSQQLQMINNEIKPLTQMPTWVQESVPNLRFEQHIYASNGEGWVNVNGRDRYEGDSVADGVIIDKILPQQVVLTYQGEKFSLPALTNW